MRFQHGRKIKGIGYEQQINRQITQPRTTKSALPRLWQVFKTERQKTSIELSQHLNQFNDTAKTRRAALASAFIPFLPMLPMHLLVQNLLYDFSQIAIPFDNVDEELVKEPQRWNPGDIGRFMLFFGPVNTTW
jgi:hypothetical protein